MKIKKSISKLYERISQMTEAEAQREITKILTSYELQIRYGSPSKLTAFSDSIHTPTTKKNIQKEEEIELQNQLFRSKIFSKAYRYFDEIKERRSRCVSYQNIANWLNSKKVHKAKFFSGKSIERFAKKFKIDNTANCKKFKKQ